MAFITVFLGGGLGSLCRYGLAKMLTGYSFPFATLWANVISCFILGALIGLNMDQILKDHQKTLLMTGFCGGFSTFSTFSAEIVQLFQNGQPYSGALYVLASLVSGILAILAGLWCSRLMT